MSENTATAQHEVELKTITLKELLKDDGFKLKIPKYQRIYSWEEKQVMRLLNDVHQYASKPYHMGTIILHIQGNGDHHIVDGQQRLVTLTLILLEIDLDKDYSLAGEKFFSEEAHKYIAYNKWLIENFLKSKKIEAERLLKFLQFSVLILTSKNLDLAYTFFTANSSRGKPLSDFDLLKSHHLRFIHLPKQAEHVAGRWDNLIRQSDNQNQDRALARTFELCLFRLRQWMRKRQWNDYEKRKVKNHFEAASILPEVPPFGEQFHFYESIQGGTHFFAYAEHFIDRYKEFEETTPYQLLGEHLNGEKHWWYRDVMEALLFAYYLKFGNQYLSDACLFISRYVAQHRYLTSRAYINSIFKYVSNSEVVMMIDQATSPTFFLGELKIETDKLQEPTDLHGTRRRFEQGIHSIKKELMPHLSVKTQSHGK